MDFSLKPDFEVSKERYKAFWEQNVLDRIPVSGLVFPNKKQKAILKKEYKNNKEKWLDVDYRAEATDIELSNNEYFADSLPTVYPNMGPAIFSAWCGCGYEFGETTAWSIPCINKWEEDSVNVMLDMEHPLFIATEKLIRALLKRGKDKFIVGLADFHPGGDHVAALRDPVNLAIDLIEDPDNVKKELKKSQKDFYTAYDYFYNILKDANMPITTWTPLIHDGRYYIPSNDFSCMISKEMFDEFFLEGIIDECRFYEKSIYHLDGPGALRHLDSLLDIKELDAVQWVPGAGNEGFNKWIDVYKRIQHAGKSMQILSFSINELDLLFEHLKPEGVWISGIQGCNQDNIQHVLKRISEWK